MKGLTKKGYIRLWNKDIGKKQFEHVMVWEKHNGRVPVGFQVHHKNEIKHDNNIENLVLLSALEHKRLHSGCYKDKKGEWIKPCNNCKMFKVLETDFYKQDKWIQGICKSCRIEKSKEYQSRVNKKLKPYGV